MQCSLVVGGSLSMFTLTLFSFHCRIFAGSLSQPAWQEWGSLQDNLGMVYA
jgi:hypothetical protein